MAQNPSLQKKEIISGSTYLAIVSAMNVFKNYNPDLAQYNIKVIYKNNDIIVSFVGKDKGDGVRGAIGGQLEFSVKLKGNDLSVIDSRFIR